LIFWALFGLEFYIFKKILDHGWTWAEFLKFQIGSGSQNMTFHSSAKTIAAR